MSAFVLDIDDTSYIDFTVQIIKVEAKVRKLHATWTYIPSSEESLMLNQKTIEAYIKEALDVQT